MLPPELDTVIVPPALLVRVAPLLLYMPMLVSVFDTMIIPPASFVRLVPWRLKSSVL